MDSVKRRILFSWSAVGLLAVLCGVLAVLQYRWTGEISRAEKERLRGNLQNAMARLSRDFDAELRAACQALVPRNDPDEDASLEAAYEARYARWMERGGSPDYFLHVALAIPEKDQLRLVMLARDSGRFAAADWPAHWTMLRDRLAARLAEGRPPQAALGSNLMEFPRFSDEGRRGPGRSFEGERDRPGPRRELNWLIVEVNAVHSRDVVLPRLIERHLGRGGDYVVEVYPRGDPSQPVYRTATGPRLDEQAADASVTLFESPRLGFERGRRNGAAGPPPGLPGPGPAMGPAPDANRGRWRMLVTHKSGSLDALVASARWRNLGISGLILALMLATAGLLMQSARQAHRYAQLQMNFVAGVSHELRTPLTVIRTAAYNLRGRIAGNPEQVERYGALIQDQSQKLQDLVEQVLRFAGTEAGRVIRDKAPVAVEDVVEAGLQSSRLGMAGSRYTLEKRVDAGLPLVMADELALKQAVQNLLDNAVKYGTEGSDWVGLSAMRVDTAAGPAVEIRVSDRGPGIPPDEQKHIFDPFFRGRRAIQDQLHGTGLGLNLVKKIAEAHGGTIRVESEPMKGTEFIMTIPAAPAEYQDEFAHSLG